MSTFADDAALAAELYEQETAQGWPPASADTKREYLLRAMAVNNAKQREAREDADAVVRITAANAYRASLPPEVSGRWVNTRQIGFLDGWDAAIAWVASQQITAD